MKKAIAPYFTNTTLNKLTTSKIVPLRRMNKKDDKTNLFFKKNGIFHKVAIAEILFIKAEGEYSITYTKNGEFMNSISLKEISNLVENYKFLRIHRSYVINLDCIDAIDINNFMVHIDGRTIPISKSNKTALLEAINIIK